MTPLDWAVFYIEHRRALTAYALALTHDSAAAADLLHDVLLRLMEERNASPPSRAYVMRCLRNRAIDLGRSPFARHAVGPLPEALFDSASATVQAREQIARAQTALQELPDGPRETIVLKMFAQLTFEEIAEILGRPLGTVTSHYARGLAVLRERLEEAPDVAGSQ